MKRPALLAGVLAVALASTTGSAVAEPKAASDHVVIRIDEASLHPATAHVKEGGAITWLNYARWKAEIRVSPDVSAKLDCPKAEWGTNDKGQAVSAPIQNLGYHLPCTLPKGTYEYTVGQASGNIGQPGTGESTATMQGKIIVE